MGGTPVQVIAQQHLHPLGKVREIIFWRPSTRIPRGHLLLVEFRDEGKEQVPFAGDEREEFFFGLGLGIFDHGEITNLFLPMS